MATGRTTPKWGRVYVAGYDLSGYSNGIGPLDWTYNEADLTAQMGDAAIGRLPNMVSISPGVVNAVLDVTANASHAIGTAGNGSGRDVMYALGFRAEPVAGDPVFCGRFQQANYQSQENGGGIFANISFDQSDASDLSGYDIPWGYLLHAKAATTAANTGTADHDNGAATAAGGYLMYQVFAGNGTATISIDDSANNTDWLALSGATSGEINFSTPTANIVALGKTATVRQYLRWQLALNSASSVTFSLAFVRGR